MQTEVLCENLFYYEKVLYVFMPYVVTRTLPTSWLSVWTSRALTTMGRQWSATSASADMFGKFGVVTALRVFSFQECVAASFSKAEDASQARFLLLDRMVHRKKIKICHMIEFPDDHNMALYHADYTGTGWPDSEGTGSLTPVPVVARAPFQVAPRWSGEDINHATPPPPQPRPGLMAGGQLAAKSPAATAATASSSSAASGAAAVSGHVVALLNPAPRFDASTSSASASRAAPQAAAVPAQASHRLQQGLGGAGAADVAGAGSTLGAAPQPGGRSTWDAFDAVQISACDNNILDGHYR